MAVIYLLLPVALAFSAFAAVVFIWAVRSGQLDDLETPAVRAVLDDYCQGRSAIGQGRHDDPDSNRSQRQGRAGHRR